MTEVNSTRIVGAVVPRDLAGLRLDQAMTTIFPDFSRSRIQGWIRSGAALLDGIVAPAKHRVLGGEQLTLQIELNRSVTEAPEAIPLSIMHEDECLLIIDKPAGLVVHPAAGHPSGTLLNALLNHCPALGDIPRCGIVHRIDKETSGLLMIAKTLEAHKSMVDQLQARTVQREYIALVQGVMTGGGTIDHPIGRHGTDRKRFAVRQGGKTAITHYRIAERFSAHTLIHVKLETGRTHQIRVHMAHILHPLVGDPVYGGRSRLPPGASETLVSKLQSFKRQALHAATLGIIHPLSGEFRSWQTGLPDDFSDLLNEFRQAPP